MLPFVTHDQRFSRLVILHANLEKLSSGCRWAEGPAYFAAGRYLIWSDIPNNRMMRFDETDASVSVFRSPSFNSNGNTVDLEWPQRVLLRAEPDASGHDPDRGDRRQCLFRRTPPQPALYLRADSLYSIYLNTRAAV